MTTPDAERAHVAVVVLNFNGTRDTLDCVASVSASTGSTISTIVVDNASADAIATALTSQDLEPVLISNAVNLGFAGGMNVGLARALELGADYILLLNNDTVVDPSMIATLVDAARSLPDAGILSPLVLDRASPKRVTSAGSRFDARRGHPGRPNLAGEVAGEQLQGVREVEASSGEAMFVSAGAVRHVGPLDDAFYLRLEDIDWSLRMRAAGRRNYVVLGARLWHGVSASSGGEHSSLNAYYHTRNILMLCSRHAPMGRARGTLREGEVLLANLVHARRGDHPLANARAVLAGWRDYRRGRMGPKEPARAE